ncbi:hypothetical protein ACLOJK_020010 [Asimina triloba]
MGGTHLPICICLLLRQATKPPSCRPHLPRLNIYQICTSPDVPSQPSMVDAVTCCPNQQPLSLSIISTISFNRSHPQLLAALKIHHRCHPVHRPNLAVHRCFNAA